MHKNQINFGGTEKIFKGDKIFNGFELNKKKNVNLNAEISREKAEFEA